MQSNQQCIETGREEEGGVEAKVDRANGKTPGRNGEEEENAARTWRRSLARQGKGQKKKKPDFLEKFQI